MVNSPKPQKVKLWIETQFFHSLEFLPLHHLEVFSSNKVKGALGSTFQNKRDGLVFSFRGTADEKG